MGKKDLIWTTHAKARAREREVKESDVWAAWLNPDKKRKAATKGAWVYYKSFGSQKVSGARGATRVEVVIKENEKGESVVLSVWTRSVYGNYKKESFLKFLLKKIFR